MGVTDPMSTEHQIALAQDIMARVSRRLFLFLNVSAIHQPNRYYVPGAADDSLVSHAAALEYVDRAIAPLFEAFQRRNPTLFILCSDHGTAYGEDGFHGHRLSHSVVWNVPYAEFVVA
jgi:hypothetical protein